MKLPWVLLLLALAQNGQQTARKPTDTIEADELRAYLASQAGCQPEEVDISTVSKLDSLIKGHDVAFVIASTCLAGNGPDVESLFARNDKGELRELTIPEVKLPHKVLFGKSGSIYRVENGLLVEAYSDTSGRNEPLVIKYKWDEAKDQFVVESFVAAKPYPTSYDCDKAEKDGHETAEAICYVKSLADLDVELAELYKTYLSGLGRESRQEAIEEQRAWLKLRNEGCPIYKWWVHCLEETYNDRSAELQKKVEEHKKSSAGAVR